KNYDIKKLYFLDPTFTINRTRAIELANALKSLDVKWTCETRVDRIDMELLQIFQKAGCNLISFGIETGSEDVHNNLGKLTTINQNELAIKMAHDAGLEVKAFLMGALPEDNWQSLELFKEFIHNNKPDTWLFSTFIPFPGTEQWKDPDKFKIKIESKDFRAYYNLGLNGRGPLNIRNQYLSREELKQVRDSMLEFLLKEVPNPRVQKAMANFEQQRLKLLPYIDGLEEKYLY
ncbi:MAG: B12-binding domain-containing radical SAM protein, partial [Clostridiales bacterium]